MTDLATRPHQSAVDEMLARARARLEWRPVPADLPRVHAAGGLVVDIRPESLRIRDGSLIGAVVLERNVLEWRLDPSSSHVIAGSHVDRVVVVVCDEGYASSLAAAALRDLGLRRATDLAGGFQAWRRWRTRYVEATRTS